ncbi:MAG: TolC family protein [Labilithrix sp.]|nr:TolC family protein [Labilithrix sp.]MCW5811501.1 TolC family protein [Labilithrix sp.]
MCRLLFALLPLLAVSCVPSLDGNPPREPNREVPASFGAATAAAPGATDLFHAPELRALVDAALRNNQELNIRLQEVIVARNEVYARRGEYLPKVRAGAGAGVERVGKNTSQGASDEDHGLPEDLGDFQFGLSGSWEIDVWKKLRNAAAAADLRYRATIEARRFLVTQIVAEIARSYYELIGIDNQLDVLARNIEVQASALEVVKLQKQAARTTELAVQRFEAEVLKNKSRRYELEQERVQTENRINFLVGRYPQPVKRDAAAFKDTLPVVASGLPSELLENRPDVRRAELALRASKLDVEVAKAAFYPSLSIEAGAGYRAFNARHLLSTPDSVVYNLAGNLTAPLLNRQAIAAQYRTANALQIEAVVDYERTLLQAFTDVVNQLALVDNLQKSYELKEQEVATLARSVEISNILFQSARADYMEVLLTRRDSLEAEMTLVETRKAQLQASVGVYQALGGGWRQGN